MTNKDIITFERKADFIKSCMIKDYLDIIPGNYSFQKTDIDSYLVTDSQKEYVLKQIQHEPCDYYSLWNFGQNA